jgi:hypothetical protein
MFNFAYGANANYLHQARNGEIVNIDLGSRLGFARA